MNFKKTYLLPSILLISIGLGGYVGYANKTLAMTLKPIGDIFLNLLMTVVVPLLFFSISSAVSQLGGKQHYKKIVFRMLSVFLLTSFSAALFMLVVMLVFPPSHSFAMPITFVNPHNDFNLSEQIVTIFTVSDFSKLFSHQNMLPLIVFAFLVGFAASTVDKTKTTFVPFLQKGAEVFMKVSSYVMYLAPIGFFAYFATIIAQLGPDLLKNYLNVTIVYSISAMIYFTVGFSLLALLSGGNQSFKTFWKNCLTPALTALATCSSAASIPANLDAAKKMGIARDVYDTVIPIGGILHKDGSVLGGMVKIAFLFGVFHMSFTGLGVFASAIIVSMLVGTVMGAIPSGGMLGEMLILSMYGFPPEALLIIAAISILVDPLATMLNVTCNTISSLVIARWTKGKDWVQEGKLLARME